MMKLLKPVHKSVLSVLKNLDTDILNKHEVLFGGGTRIVLELGEYRASKTIRFMCSDPEGYRDIRSLVKEKGFEALFKKPVSIPGQSEMIDRSGIHFSVTAADNAYVDIAVEIIRESRFSFGRYTDLHGPRVDIRSLAMEDAVFEKVLANSDRRTDRAVRSRDIIDIGAVMGERAENVGMLEEKSSEMKGVYGLSVYRDLITASREILTDENWRNKCFAALDVDPATDQRILNGVTETLRFAMNALRLWSRYDTDKLLCDTVQAELDSPASGIKP